MHDERHRQALEPAVAKRQLFGVAELQPDTGGEARPGHGEHLAARVDPPDLRPGPLDERRRERAGSAAHVQNPSAAQVTLPHEHAESLPPGAVLRP